LFHILHKYRFSRATTRAAFSDLSYEVSTPVARHEAMTLQILIVEDHGDTRRVLTCLLGHFGHSISAADTVKSAMAFLKAKRFDAVVSDLGLPDGSGFDVIREAKRRQRLTGVALTARGEWDDIEQGREAGFDYHLTKPVDFSQLRGVLAHIAPAENSADA
jgi:CheY-like chemotaxis protein